MKKIVLGAVVLIILVLIIQRTFPHAVKSGNTISATSQQLLPITTNLSMGSKSPDVMTLQMFLIDKKILSTSTMPIEFGLFGSSTLIAVMNYQRSKNISPVDGMVNILTRMAINEDILKGTPATTTLPSVQSFDVNQSTSKPNTYQVSYVLVNVDEASNISVNVVCQSGLTVQRMDDANNLSPFTCGDITAGGANGYFPSIEKNLVLVFTNSTSKPITAVVKLYTRGIDPVSKNITITPKTITVTPPVEPCKSVQSSGFKLDHTTYEATMIDGKGNRDFTVNMTPNNSCVRYTYEIEASGDLANAILGSSKGTGVGKTSVQKRFSDAKLSLSGRATSAVYKGRLKVTITSTTNSSDKVYLYENLVLTLKR